MLFSLARAAYFSCCSLVLAGSVNAPPTRGLSAESTAFETAQLRHPELRPAERLPAYLRRDFGPLWTQTDEASVVGFIGPAYQRLEAKVLTATRSSTDPAQYVLTGKTRTAGTVRSFTGTVRLVRLREATPRPHIGGGDDRLPVGTQEGVVVGHYTFSEPTQQAKTGMFRGVVITRWYVDGRGRLRYNNADLSSDDFSNNQFVGTWTSYATGRASRCNWGDYRVPNAGPLDIGAGEFSPDPKYYAAGWKTYAAAQPPKSSRTALTKPWWK
ncbi:hypothetical protein [Hymenobacter arizonensis]|uniref:Uncharacterized protein n=1 Tax=Hymenobacter arizonensis TaxID=1227077 RepID=A0A1I6BDA0_HYMAR|nr:hypothetical protein [Hymenobacter arizonensis]SFQ78874.1 hypothetical protein SAMN04515668_4372 [Hymenobacter arizonensis]